MFNILVLTKNHPVEIGDIVRQLYTALGGFDQKIFIGSPQITADEVAQAKKCSYLQTYYPAMRAYRKVNEFAEKNDISVIITVGAVDVHDLNSYDAIVGIDNPELQSYTEFDEDFNTDHAVSTTLKNSDIIFDNIEQLIHFLRVIIKNNEEKEGK